MATHGDSKWRALRLQRQYQASAPCSTGAAGASTCSSAHAPDGLPHVRARYAPPAGGKEWPCEIFLRELQQVYPIETPEPPGLASTIRLKPYQKQSLAFCLNIEHNTTELDLIGKIVKRNVEKDVRGCWVADEMGMGKTMVAISLILANPSKEKPVTDAAWAKFNAACRLQEYHEAVRLKSQTHKALYEEHSCNYSLCSKDPRYVQAESCVSQIVDDVTAATKSMPEIKLKATLVITPNSLLGQWADEIKRAAPSLVVLKYHGATKAKALKNLHKADVILTTPQMPAPYEMSGTQSPSTLLCYHRIIIDESHKYCSMHHYNYDRCVMLTGTPISSSTNDLYGGLMALGLADIPRRYDPAHEHRPFVLNINRYHCGMQMQSSSPSFDPDYDYRGPAMRDALKRILIRHAKSQRIGGEVALSLPDAECDTVWLTMTPAEREMYEFGLSLDSKKASYMCRQGGKTSYLEKAFLFARQSTANWYSINRSRPHTAFPRSMVDRFYGGVGSSGGGGGRGSGLAVDDSDENDENDDNEEENDGNEGKAMCKTSGKQMIPSTAVTAEAGSDNDDEDDDDDDGGCYGGGSAYGHAAAAARYAPISHDADLSMCTKLRALKEDLLALHKQDKSCHAVVFTHHVDVHETIVRMLEGTTHFDVLQITGKTSAEKRAKQIREFQASASSSFDSPAADASEASSSASGSSSSSSSSSSAAATDAAAGGKGKSKGKAPVVAAAAASAKAKVFVITVKTGSVGITLTAVRTAIALHSLIP